MNKIHEILEVKRRNKTEETIYETYARELCSQCRNKYNNKDLCRITVTRDRKARCINYKCLTKKCHGCDDEVKCFKKEN